MSHHDQFSTLFSFLSYKDDAEKIADKYPWCSVAQLSLLKKYKQTNSENSQKHAAKTALLFNNIRWINWQLHLLSSKKEIPEINPEETVLLQDTQDRSEKIEQSLSQISAVANTADTEIEFEPLHTTDYFASQGIRLTDKPVSNDKLGSQMKSFTEWLKSMKKIHKEKLDQGDEQTDKNIQQIAEYSNVKAEVVTEAMAEVLIKQDKPDKAIEVYHKLSLIYPSKSAYFAAKIESLSGNS